MDDKKFVILIYSGMGLLVCGLMIFLFISIKSNSRAGGKDIDYENIKTLNSDEKIFSSKTVAYESSDKDSFLNIREENVGVDFSSLFKDEPGDNSSFDNTKEKEDDKNTGIESDKPSSNTQSYKHMAVSKKKALAGGNNCGKSQLVSSLNEKNPASSVSSLSVQEPKRRDGFYSTNNAVAVADKPASSSSLRAVIHTRQEAYQGSTVKMRTISPISVDGTKIPVNTFIYGSVSMGQERVHIKVSSIIYNNQLFRVDYLIFDRDGIEGVYVPGLLLHDLSRETERGVIKDIDLNVPVVGAASLNVSRKKIAQQKAILTDNYQVILKN